MEKSKVRIPAVAGQFYHSSKHNLKTQIEALIDKGAKKQDAVACLLPHAGYIYSGRVAAETVSRLKVRDKIVLLGPNHTGYGAPFSIMTEGVWQTPLGELKINSHLASKILENSRYLEEDVSAQTYEHSLEVELPFLQYFKGDFEIVPIVILSENTAVLKKIGEDIAATIIREPNTKDSTLLIASSDMTHYEPQNMAQKKDKTAIEAILELDEDKLMEKVRQLNISMCGYAPTVAMLSAAKALGAHNAELVRYQTSGDVTGDFGAVVGYAGIIIY